MERSNPLPAHLVTAMPKKRGWAGEEMEMNHSRSSLSAPGETTTTNATTIDFSQFRNEEVGQGYQAKGVVRQKSHAEREEVKIIDMTRNVELDALDQQQHAKIDNQKGIEEDTTKSGAGEIKSKPKRRKKKDDNQNHGKTTLNIETLLPNDGLRIFRKELEKIISETNR